MKFDYDNVPSANEFIVKNSHLSNEDMLKKFAKLHVYQALEAAFKVSRLDVWEKDLIYSCYPQDKIK